MTKSSKRGASGRRAPSGQRLAQERGAPVLAKVKSGIKGLDEITGGGLPRGRPTLVCGGPGCGKTLLAMEFLVRGILDHGEPGVFFSFEESEEELAANVASLGFDIPGLVARNKLAIDHVRVERDEIEETGEYNLEGLFVRIANAVESVGAKRVALDTIESLFASLPNQAILRSELRRLFRWLKDRALTVVITGEKGEGTLTRQGLEEYVSDCVICLDHRITDQISTRRLRVVKYRGSEHGTNEYPFLIDKTGISVLPITSMGLDHEVPFERVSTGIPRLDEMLGGKGYFKGSTILVTGTAGTGKTSFAACLARDFCRRGQRALYFSLEESTSQILRNLPSIGVNLAPFVQDGTLRILPSRPQAVGLEQHLSQMYKAVVDFDPALVIMDPVSNMIGVGTVLEARSMLTRLIDFLKGRAITTLFTNLTSGTMELEETDVGISSLIDTWLVLEIVRSGGERNRVINIIKSRGMPHSNQTSEFRLTDRGIEIVDTYLGPSGVLTGSTRVAKEAEDEAAKALGAYELEQKRASRESRRRAFENRRAALEEEFKAEDAALERDIKEQEILQRRVDIDRAAMATSRGAFTAKAMKQRRKERNRV